MTAPAKAPAVSSFHWGKRRMGQSEGRELKPDMCILVPGPVQNGSSRFGGDGGGGGVRGGGGGDGGGESTAGGADGGNGGGDGGGGGDGSQVASHAVQWLVSSSFSGSNQRSPETESRQTASVPQARLSTDLQSGRAARLSACEAECRVCTRVMVVVVRVKGSSPVQPELPFRKVVW